MEETGSLDWTGWSFCLEGKQMRKSTFTCYKSLIFLAGCCSLNGDCVSMATFSSSWCDVSALIWIMCVDTLLSLFQIWSGGTIEHLEVVAAAWRPIRACSMVSFHALSLSADAIRRSWWQTRIRRPVCGVSWMGWGASSQRSLKLWEHFLLRHWRAMPPLHCQRFSRCWRGCCSPWRSVHRNVHSYCFARSHPSPFFFFSCLRFVNILGTSCLCV